MGVKDYNQFQLTFHREIPKFEVHFLFGKLSGNLAMNFAPNSKILQRIFSEVRNELRLKQVQRYN